MKTYGAKEISELSGATKMQLNHWVNYGAIIPAVDDPRRGGVRKYSKQNLAEAMVCKKLNDYQISARVISEATSHMRSQSFGKFGRERDAWQILEKNPKMFLGVSPIGHLSINGESVPVELFSEIFPDHTLGGENALYTSIVFPKKDVLKSIENFYSMLLIDLEMIVRKSKIFEK